MYIPWAQNREAVVGSCEVVEKVVALVAVVGILVSGKAEVKILTVAGKVVGPVVVVESPVVAGKAVGLEVAPGVSCEVSRNLLVWVGG